MAYCDVGDGERERGEPGEKLWRHRLLGSVQSNQITSDHGVVEAKLMAGDTGRPVFAATSARLCIVIKIIAKDLTANRLTADPLVS